MDFQKVDEMIATWLKTEFRETMGRFFIREAINVAQVMDIPITAIHMIEGEPYGYWIN